MGDRIGLALGGGGARGLAHLGVLRVLEREKIPIHAISGTSMGAIIGACYAMEQNIQSIEGKIIKIMNSPSFKSMRFDFLKNADCDDKKGIIEKTRKIVISGMIHIIEETKDSYLPADKLESIINALLPDIDIKKTKTPFTCIAADLTNGKEKIFSEGSLRKCVYASAAIPGVFPPIKIDDVYYNDGGSVDVTPVNAFNDIKVDHIIAVDVKSRVMRWEKVANVKEIMARSNYITSQILSDMQLKNANAVISPMVKHIHWTGFDKAEFLITQGEKAAELKVSGIKRMIETKNIWQKLLNIINKKTKLN
jgi:NTE family protein